ncbi:hypothetical protein [Haloarcula amylovorans]|uniref:hypothetical protein n=1 Tax=Haloarcula amylovorans TaxID=2562280 RepID=UPI001076009E|nr:hypothetical protein [Halomicroarcula amylolytica]
MTRQSIALLALVVLLVASPIVAFADAADDSAGNSSEFTLDELKQDGPHQANSPPGVRMGEQSAYWSVYWPANNPFANVGSSDSGEYLPSGTTVGRNAVYLRTWTYEDRTKDVHVVYWEKGTKTVKQGNTTTTEPVARNVTHVTHEVTFDRGRPTVKVPLRQHDEPVRVTMWIEGEDYARWTFKHKSIATTQGVDINSAGDYIASVITDFLLWILIGGFVVGSGTKKALDKAGIGPQYGYFPWLVGLTLLTGLGGLLFYKSLANLVVNAQYLLALYVVAVIGIVMLETYTTNVSKALFLRPTLTHAESPTGDDAFDLLDAEGREERIVRTPDGSVSVVKPGLFPFLARVFGKNARIKNVEQLRTRVPIDGKWDELFLVDPEADELLFYEPEGWTIDWPPLDREHAGEWVAVVGAVGLAFGSVHYGIASALAVTTVTVAGLAVWALHPTDGLAAVQPAPVHLRTAFGTMVAYAEDVDDAKRFDEVKSQLDGERISKQRDVDREVADHDRTLVEGMLDPDEQIPAAVEDGESDDDVTGKRRENGSALGNGEVADDG